LNQAVRQGLAEAFTALGRDPEVRCIVLTGDAQAFAAGADLKEMAAAGAVEILLRGTHLLWKAIADCPKPVIAAVNGFALGGGCELAPARAPSSASRRCASASCRAPAAPSG
jgi:enoyl-CoA hydratase/carnithine racemase